MIVSGGYNIAGPEVEGALLLHPAVAECGVVGAADEARGQIVKAYVVLKPGHAADDALARALQDFVQADHRALQVPARDRVSATSCRAPRPASCSASGCATADGQDERTGLYARLVKKTHWRALLAAMATGLALVLSSPAARADPDQARCPGPPHISVRARAAADAQAACDGARRAIDFLVAAGLDPPPELTIDIVEQLPGELRGLAVGCYVRDTQRIVLLSYDAFEATGSWLRTPVDRELYRSAASHEMAHAVVGCNAASPELPVPAHEYVAYVAMFATMEPAVRQRVLARFGGTGFDSTLQINTVVYLVDPLQFAVDAWRHYLKRRDGAAWLRDVVAGHVVQVFPTDGP
jgi:hypothetical protein